LASITDFLAGFTRLPFDKKAAARFLKLRKQGVCGSIRPLLDCAGHVPAFPLADMSASEKAPTCRSSPLQRPFATSQPSSPAASPKEKNDRLRPWIF
jgi:hypothetical protein